MRRLLTGMALALIATGAAACGYCVEDKIAATYDHSVVTQALARHHHVVFFHVDGTASRRRIEEAAHATRGIDAGTARVSADLLTVSFAFDPTRATLAAIQARMEKKLALPLMPLRVMETPADLKLVKR